MTWVTSSVRDDFFLYSSRIHDSFHDSVDDYFADSVHNSDSADDDSRFDSSNESSVVDYSHDSFDDGLEVVNYLNSLIVGSHHNIILQGRAAKDCKGFTQLDALGTRSYLDS